MNQILTLLKLEFKSNASKVFNKNRAITFFLTNLKNLFKICLILIAFYICLKPVFSLFSYSGLTSEFIVFYLAIVFIFQFCFALTSCLKNMFFNQESSILLSIVSPTKLLISKLIYLLIKDIITCFILVFPVLIYVGVVMGFGSAFFATTVFLPLFLALIAFSLALIIAIPAVYVCKFLKNKFFIILLLYIALLVAGFVLYIKGLNFILNYLQGSTNPQITNSGTIIQLKEIASSLPLSSLFRNLLFGHKLAESCLIILSTCVLLLIIAVVLIKSFYKRAVSDSIEFSEKSFTKATKVTNNSVFSALFKKEIISIFRSVNYSFQYLAIVVTTPLLVYFCNVITMQIASNKVGEIILPGVSILVILMFLCMGTSFAATSFSREGESFYITKIIPVDYKKQVLVKCSTYLLIAIPSAILSSIILSIAGFLNWADASLLALAMSLVVTGNVFKSISIDIRKPKFITLVDGEITKANLNVGLSLSIGFIIALLLGIGGIVISLILSLPSFYYVLFGFSIAYILVESVMLFINVSKKYARIEV